MRRDGARPLDDRIRMLHMLEAAREALEFSQGRVRADLESDAMLRRALLNCVQEIGEAASQVSDAGRARATEIPWQKIVGMRHRMVHAYYDINRDSLWKVVEQHLEPLVDAIESALAHWPEAD